MISISVYHRKIKVPVPRTKFCHFVGSSNCISLMMQRCFLIFVIGVLNKVFPVKFHRRITFLPRHMCITRLIWVNLLFYSYRYSTSHHIPYAVWNMMQYATFRITSHCHIWRAWHWRTVIVCYTVKIIIPHGLLGPVDVISFIRQKIRDMFSATK